MENKGLIIGITSMITITGQPYSRPVTVFNEEVFDCVEIDNSPYESPIVLEHPTERLLSQIDLFIELYDNWDGFGALAPLSETIENTKKLIRKIPDDLLRLLEDEDLVPSPRGTLSLYFEDLSGNELTVEVGKDFMGVCGDVDGKEILIDEILVDDTNEVVETLSHLEV